MKFALPVTPRPENVNQISSRIDNIRLLTITKQQSFYCMFATNSKGLEWILNIKSRRLIEKQETITLRHAYSLLDALIHRACTNE